MKLCRVIDILRLVPKHIAYTNLSLLKKKCFKYIQKYTRYDFGDSLSVNDVIQKFIFSFFLIKSKYQSSETETT